MVDRNEYRVLEISAHGVSVSFAVSSFQLAMETVIFQFEKIQAK